MTDLRPCPACRRHVAIAAPACPFCAVELAPSEAPHMTLGRLSRAAVFAGATLATACGGKTKPADHATPPPSDAGVAKSADAAPQPVPNNVPMPYGAPPARRRVVEVSSTTSSNRP